MAAPAGPETVVALARRPNSTDAAAGLSAAAVLVATGQGPFLEVLDYLSYDSACVEGDAVCEGLPRSEIGLAAVREQRDGRTFVVLGGLDDRRVDIRTVEGELVPARPGPAGAAIEVGTAEPWKVKITVHLAGGRTYELPLPPGGVIED